MLPNSRSKPHFTHYTYCNHRRSIVIFPSASFQESSCTKMDKADILELTVQHLQSMQQRHRQVKYTAGYEECAGEVTHYMSRTPVHPDLSARLMQHLDGQMVKENRAPATSPRRVMPACPSPSYGVPCTTPLASLRGLCYVAATPLGLTAHHEAAAPYCGSRAHSPLSGRVSLHAAGQRPQDTRTSSPLIADDVPDTDYGRLSATGPTAGLWTTRKRPWRPCRWVRILWSRKKTRMFGDRGDAPTVVTFKLCWHSWCHKYVNSSHLKTLARRMLGRILQWTCF